MYGKILCLTKTTILPVVIVTILLTSPIPVRGNFTEDFSTDLSDWTLYTQNELDNTNHSWSLVNEALTSTGETPEGQFIELNLACHDTGFDTGIFEYEFFGPEGPFRIAFRIARNYGVNDTTGLPLVSNPSHIQVIANVGLDNNGFNVNSDPTIIIAGLFHNGVTQRGWYGIGERPSLAETQLRGWHNIKIMKNDTNIEVFLDNEYVRGGILPVVVDDTHDSICIWMDKGTGAAIDNIHITDLPNPEVIDPSSNDGETDYPQLIMLGSIGIISISVVTFGGRSIYKKKQIRRAIELRKLNLQTIRTVNHEFDLSDKSIYTLLLGATKVSDEYAKEKVKELLPQDILTHRYLMHPIRLTIMKLLHSQDKMRSADIKNLLDVTWGEYGNHIKSLEQKGYVEVSNDFTEDGNVVQVVYILEFGRKQFQQLFTLLQQFVAKTSPFEYLIYAQANLKDPDLYPEKTGFE